MELEKESNEFLSLQLIKQQKKYVSLMRNINANCFNFIIFSIEQLKASLDQQTDLIKMIVENIHLKNRKENF
jgi:hypothetical protein